MIRLDNRIKNIGIIIFFIVAIVFAETRKTLKKCTQIDLNIEDQFENKFIDIQDVRDLVSDYGKRAVVGGKLIHTSLKSVEEAVKNNNFVERVSVAKNHAGVLKINVSQVVPVARAFSKDSSFYLTQSKGVVCLSNKYTSRVLLVRGLGVDKYLLNVENESGNYEAYFSFFNYINEDDFLRAQVAEVFIADDGEISILPQITKQVIEFGEPEKIVDKFNRLKIFYKRILPEKGWNHYEKVNLKYNNQIICS